MDDDLKTAIWNLLTTCFWERYEPPSNLHPMSTRTRRDYIRGSNIEGIVTELWIRFFKYPIDEMGYWRETLQLIRNFFFGAKWFDVYDFIEFMAHQKFKIEPQAFAIHLNFELEKENSAYRMVDLKIVEITSEAEITEIEDAIAKSTPFSGVKTHLNTALTLLSDRKNPDYRNSIKESISAVESLASQISGGNANTLGKILSELERNNKLHPALKSAFSSLYGYTNDANGIRHAILDEPNLTQAEARFMLISCSAFTNYVIATTQTS